jgi:hypothetical protein
MDQLKAPEKLNFDAPVSHTWKKWKEEFSLYADLAMEDKGEKLKVKMFKYLIGGHGREVYDTLSFVEEENGRTIKILQI